MADKTTTEQTNLSESERNDLARAIAESDITDGLLENEDIDALVDLFESWLERRSTAPTVEQALAELREIFPGVFVEAQTGDGASWHPAWPVEPREHIYHYALVTVEDKQVRAVTLNEAMTEIREWHAEQAKG